jgi:outer membrane protein assembly factor BamE
MQKPTAVITYLATLFLAGCSLIYRVDIHQGNVISQEMVNQLKPGMTKRQVAFLLGTPLVADPFHDDRWDYVYSNHPDDEDLVQKKITLVFRNDELASLQGDLKPGTLPSIEMSRDQTVDIPRIERQKTLWQKITGLFGVES